MKIYRARQIAEDFIAQIQPYCERVEIAGSIRRLKPNPKDLELVCIPLPAVEVEKKDLFGDTYEVAYDDGLREWLGLRLAHGGWDWRLDHINPKNGNKYKRLRHIESNLAMDLFITDARRWPVIYTIRTGPGEFSQALVTIIKSKRWRVSDGLVHLHPIPGAKCPKGDSCELIADLENESDIFELIGIPYIHPIKRSANLLWKTYNKAMDIKKHGTEELHNE